MPTARMKNNGSKTDKRRKSHGHTPLLEASPLVRRFAARIVDAAGNAPILDVASGMGRNAMIFAQLGCTVICLDKNQDLLRRLPNNPRILPTQMDLATDRWLFGRSHLGGIVNVHFLLPAIFRRFKSSLSPGGYLLIETVPAHGNNFLELPKEGELRSALERAFDFDFYQEKKAGPPEYKKVTVRLLARRRD
jgi:hypothetical protein